MDFRVEYDFKLTDDDEPLVHRHRNSVSFFSSRGDVKFSIELLPCHLPIIREIVSELEELKSRLQKLAQKQKQESKSEQEVSA